ncbi:alpha/beta hydrolase [Streptomyces chiangmaiensis]|uniref:Alpha/beta hydrolase n=1 Tax=Streptomyces chiangmaiensis TaxID=766497 RepID=A0ABU7FR98_9ACTN|nr:alpha/beta hydrolase [Streptomyces chiangmaiensis]MED7825993.1 alpha/beta hydrolase [Streptomyces chiangmaiensis]
MGTNAPVHLDAYAKRFLAQLAAADAPPLETLSPAEARADALAGRSAAQAVLKPVHIHEQHLPIGPGGTVLVRIVRPEGSSGVLPAVMYFHGGGWVLGDRFSYDRTTRDLAHAGGVAVVFVEYARSPEARYPVALEEVYAATAWIAEHGQELGLDGSRLAVAGDSAGGNLATAVALLAKRRGGPRLLQQVLFYPALDAGFDTPSYERFADGFFLTRAQMRWFGDRYAPDRSVRTEPTAAPLRATTAELAGLPPALVITAEADVLRDEGEAYARKLTQAGVPVVAVRYLGAIHSFTAQDALAASPLSQAAIDQAGQALRQALAAPRPEAGGY